MKYQIFFSFFISLLISSCSNPTTSTPTVYVYTEQQDIGYEQAFQAFKIETGIRVVLKQIPFEEILKKLQEKNETDSADVLILNDLGLMIKAEKLGLLKKTKQEEIDEHVPLKYRHPDRLWFGLGKHYKVLVYNPLKINPEELSSYQDLASPKWLRQLTQSTPNLATNRSFLAAMLAHEGQENSQEWLQNFNKNLVRPAQGEDLEQVQAIAQGIANLAIVSSNAVGKYLKLKPENSSNISVFFPNQSTYGTHLNLSSAAVLQDAPNALNAAKLIGFLSGKKGQEILTNQSFLYPVYSAVSPVKVLESWGDFKADGLDFNFLLGQTHVFAPNK